MIFRLLPLLMILPLAACSSSDDAADASKSNLSQSAWGPQGLTCQADANARPGIDADLLPAVDGNKTAVCEAMAKAAIEKVVPSGVVDFSRGNTYLPNVATIVGVTRTYIEATNAIGYHATVSVLFFGGYNYTDANGDDQAATTAQRQFTLTGVFDDRFDLVGLSDSVADKPIDPNAQRPASCALDNPVAVGDDPIVRFEIVAAPSITSPQRLTLVDADGAKTVAEDACHYDLDGQATKCDGSGFTASIDFSRRIDTTPGSAPSYAATLTSGSGAQATAKCGVVRNP